MHTAVAQQRRRQTHRRPFGGAVFRRLAVGLLLACGTASAQAAGARCARLERIATLMHERYVDPTLGAATAARLRSATARGTLGCRTSARAFAAAVNRELARLGDGHLTLFVDPTVAATLRQSHAADGTEPTMAPAPAPTAAADTAEAEGSGVRRVEVLAGNVGYLDLREFAPARPTTRAVLEGTLAILRSTDAVVIDLRANSGGHGETVEWLASHFFPDSVRLLDTYDRPTNRRTVAWSRRVPAPSQLVSQPLVLLTSRSTYSAAEAFAFDLRRLGRVMIVGDTTGGGAHPTEYHEVDDSLVLALPQARSEDPVTRTNWQGVGIPPHLVVPSDRALLVAHAALLDTLVRRAARPSQRRALEWYRTLARADLAPLRVPATLLRRATGRYGERTLRVRTDGRCGVAMLEYQLDGRAPVRLKPLSVSHQALRFAMGDDAAVEVHEWRSARPRLLKWSLAGDSLSVRRARR